MWHDSTDMSTYTGNSHYAGFAIRSAPVNTIMPQSVLTGVSCNSLFINSSRRGHLHGRAYFHIMQWINSWFSKWSKI